MTWSPDLRTFAYFDVDSPEHDAILAWLAANSIPAGQVPANAVLALAPPTIAIRMFDFDVSTDIPEPSVASSLNWRTVSLLDWGSGFVKCERQFPLLAKPEDFGVTLVPVERGSA